MKAFAALLWITPFTCFEDDISITPVTYDIILPVGQSNCMGMATLEAVDSNSGAWLWTDAGWERADGPLNRYSNVDDNNWGRLSMVNSFGKEAANHTPLPKLLGLVVNARASSSIQAWGDSLMLISIQRAKDCLADNPGSRVTAILWHQGESNSHNPETYRYEFTHIRHYVDSLLGYNIPILMGGLSHFPLYQSINDTIQSVATSVHDCYYVRSDSLVVYDGTHFDSPSQRIFGLRYYAVYLRAAI